MKGRKRRAIGCLLLSFALGACGKTTATTAPVAASVEPQPTPARLEDDFYYYVNADTLANAEFPYGESTCAGAFDNHPVDEERKAIVREVVAGDGYEAGTEEDLIRRACELYAAYDFENTPVPAELEALFQQIDAIGSLEEFMDMDAMLWMDYGVPSILNLDGDIDTDGSGNIIPAFVPYDAILDTHFDDAEDNARAFNDLKNQGTAMLRALGHDTETADQWGKEFGRIGSEVYYGTDLEAMHSERKEAYYKVYTRAQVDAFLTAVDLDRYLTACGIDPNRADRFGVTDPGQLAALNGILTEENLNALKTWKITALAGVYTRFVAYSYQELEEYIVNDYSSDEDIVLNEILWEYPAELEPLYVERYYTEEIDAAVRAMFEEIRGGYRELISEADWLSEETRAGLLRKLENIVCITGSNVTRHDPADYLEVSGEDYFTFYVSYHRVALRKRLQQLFRPMDRNVPFQSMTEMNAWYLSTTNSIQVNAAIMRAPFYDPKADHAANLGGLGHTIAHEIGHAFDSNNILYDENGQYDPAWIGAGDLEKLNARNEEAVRYFAENFTVYGVYHVDGQRTLGENYADLSGMECLMTLADTPEERRAVFENYARTWCEKSTVGRFLALLRRDTHAPYVIRANAILSTTDAFYEVYEIKEGDGMYIAPENRISRWH